LIYSLKNLDDVKAAMAPFAICEDTSALCREVQGKGFVLPNAMANQPMEGCDAAADGSPTELTLRRYRRYAAGGTGLIWAEAIAVVPEGRGNPRHLWIHEGNVTGFRGMIEAIHEEAKKNNLPRPVVIAQLTHAGRNTSLGRVPATRHTVLDPHQKVTEATELITDEALDALQEDYVKAALLCKEAGFDGVDVKCCHLYLFSELLGAYSREGRYGGSMENRFRMTLETLEKVKAACGEDFIYASRMNAADCFAGGFDTDENLEPKLQEALFLARGLAQRGVTILNITLGTPYFNPHINRPYASYPKGEGYDQPEDPMIGVKRLFTACGMIQQSLPEVVCVATGFSYLRQWAPYVGAGLVKAGLAKSCGFGRQSFAYPDFAVDILNYGEMKKEKSCVTCGLCTYLMRNGKNAGCPVRDTQVYRPLLDEIRR